MDYRRGSGRYDEAPREDEPKYSRLFVIGGKSASEDELRSLFSQYGEIEYLSVKKDRSTNTNKGFSYVKFKKTSDAADAMDELNGTVIGSDSRPIKVVIASNRGDGASGPSEDITATRLFIMVPKTMEISEITEAFSAFGPVEHVSLVRDKGTGEPRGLAYVNYHKFSHAARAFENCDASFRAKFAEPKGTASGRGGRGEGRGEGRGGGGGGHWDGMSGGGGMGSGGMGGGYDYNSGMVAGYQNTMSAMMNMMQYPSITSNSCRLKVLFNPSTSKDMFWMLFNIVPGLVSCDLVEITTEGAIGCVTYSNPQSAAYALERINGFEYPTGSRIQIKIDESTGSMSTGMSMGPGASMSDKVANVPSDIKSLISTIQQATETLKSSGFGNLVGAGGGGVMEGGAGMGGGGGMGMGGGGVGMGGAMGYSGGSVDAQSVCSAKLPPRQPCVPSNTRCDERLFFVLKEAREIPDPAIITDLFCRFGDLIDAVCIRGKKCGYARYGSRLSSSQAMACLNNEDVLGSRIKIEVADEERKPKRARLD